MIYLIKGDIISVYLYGLLKDKYKVSLASKLEDIKDATVLVLPRKGIDSFNTIYGTEIDIDDVINNNPCLRKIVIGNKNYDFSRFTQIEVFPYLEDIKFKEADIGLQILSVINSVTSELLLAPNHISFLVCGDEWFVKQVEKKIKPFGSRIKINTKEQFNVHCIITNRVNTITLENYNKIKHGMLIYDFSSAPHAISYELSRVINGKYLLVNNLGSIYYPKSSALIFADFLRGIL